MYLKFVFLIKKKNYNMRKSHKQTFFFFKKQKVDFWKPKDTRLQPTDNLAAGDRNNLAVETYIFNLK